jgi:ATP-dependent Clp protease ATP-binding subunit ClpC
MLIGLAAGIIVMRSTALKNLFAAGSRTDRGAQSAQPLASEAGDDSLSLRLHRLASAIEPFATSSAHPRECTEHPAFQQATSLLLDESVPLDTVVQYALGINWMLGSVGLAALGGRKDGAKAVDQVLAQCDRLSPFAMYFALEYLSGLEDRPPVGAPLAAAKDWWSDNILLPLLFVQHFERRRELGDAPTFGSSLYSSQLAPSPVRAFLSCVQHPYAQSLLAELIRHESASTGRGFLSSFGRFWSETSREAGLIEAESWREALASAEASIEQDPPRSLIVSGEPAVGKTTFLRLLAERLSFQGWTVFEASGAELMAGQLWFGQLEERVKRTVEELAVGKRIIWYVPDLLQLARSGTHQGQSASILDQILPALNDGRIVVWTEATPSAASRLFQLRPRLRHLLELVRLEPMSEAETAHIANAVAERLSERLGIGIDADCIPVALDAARQYLNASSLPGSALTLLKLAIGRTEAGELHEIGPQQVHDSLAQLTGLPVSILDNRERIDLGRIRQFFASRIIGQDEAVESIIERIAMLKAGLNDPDKPIGVFLFAGPTGTGKTELAKTTAEYLFGSADRMIRLDMSEFQTAESTATILGEMSAGAGGESQSLIARVRKQPFSLVLLDEFEKAHPRIWDLFLQVFDEGRLSDALGQVGDFRHCLIILTSNLGVPGQPASGFGFAPVAPDSFSSEPILRAIRQTYRPEFQNRIDRIIVFRPLTRDLMRNILRKELDEVLERRGLRDRAWAVEWESSALEFLLEKGFSPDMGARPLKRAIDQYVLAPLAATIVEWRFPQGEQFVFFRSDGRAIQAEFVDPDRDSRMASAAADDDVPGEPLALESMIISPRGSEGELAALRARLAETEDSLGEDWEQLKARLAGEMSSPGFWSDPRRFELLARIALMDRVSAAADTARSLAGRLVRGADRSGEVSRELVSRLALQLHLVRHGARDVQENAPVEVALLIEPALDSNAEDGAGGRAWCGELCAMYRGWAQRRNMQFEELAPLQRDGHPILLVSGFGAHRVLAGEAGLHILERPEGQGGPSRITARVCIAPSPLGDHSAAQLRSALTDAFGKTPRPSTVVRRYRREPSPLVRNANGSRRTGKLDAVLAGDFDLIVADQR